MLSDFVFYIQCGDEIEFHLGEYKYFIQPDYSSLNENFDKQNPPYTSFVLYDVTNIEKQQKILYGTTEEIINYKFCGDYTLKYNFDKFCIDYVL